MFWINNAIEVKSSSSSSITSYLHSFLCAHKRLETGGKQ